MHTPEFSDYFAALKRRRMLLAAIMLPIAAIAVALAIGLPDIYVSTGLITFKDATVSGELPTDKERARREKEKAYMDQYVNSLANFVLSAPNLGKLLERMPNLVPAGETRADALQDIVNRTSVETVRVPVLDPDTGREREIISAVTVSYSSRDPQTAQKFAALLTDEFLAASRSNLLVRAKAAAQFYNSETQRYRGQITQLEARLAQFKGRNFGELPELTDLNLNVMDRTERDLADVGQQLRAARQDKIFLQQQLEQARNAGTDEGLLAQLQADYHRRLATYDENHPDMIALRRQIDALRA